MQRAPLVFAAAVVLAMASACTLPSWAQSRHSAPPYTFTDLGGLPGLSFRQSWALDINEDGVIAGHSHTAGVDGPGSHTTIHPVVWHRDTAGELRITDLGLAVPPGAVGSGQATAINDRGEVAGWLVGQQNGVWVHHSFLVRPEDTDADGKPELWFRDDDGDGLNDLMALYTDIPGIARGMNDDPMIVVDDHLVRFDGAGGPVVNTLPGFAYDVNNGRQVAGVASGPSGGGAAIWQLDADANVIGTTTLFNLPGHGGSVATCINAAGQAAGNSDRNDARFGYVQRATLWANGPTPTDLGTLGGTNSRAMDLATVNGVVEVVGEATNRNGNWLAFRWQSGVMTDLTRLMALRGIELGTADAINGRGQIVGQAGFSRQLVNNASDTSEAHGFLLTPR